MGKHKKAVPFFGHGFVEKSVNLKRK